MGEVKVDLTLPEWTDERNIRIFAGIEEVAHRYAGKGWKIKTVRCNLCGKCCANVAKNWPYGRKLEWRFWTWLFRKPKYRCKHLRYSVGWKGWVCDLGRNRPFTCSGGDFSDKDFCCIEWEDV